MSRLASSFRSVAGSSLAAGCISWAVRHSSYAFSGAVVAAMFGSAAAARSFSRLWAARCGVSCVVRRGAASGSWVVSVPCLWVAPAGRGVPFRFAGAWSA